MSLGFEQSDAFEPALAVESNNDAADTWEVNFGYHIVRDESNLPSPIETIEFLLDADVVIGGPPCQAFSYYNVEGIGWSRRALWEEYMRGVNETQAQAFVFENVRPFLDSGEKRALVEEAERQGFIVEARVLNAADYGTPQDRKRTIIIGTKSSSGSIVWPAKTHGPEADQPWCTFRKAVEDLPLEPSGENWHNPRRATELSLERYRTIPGEGESRLELAKRRPDITPICWLYHNTGARNVFGRLWWDRPSPTLLTEFYKPEKGRSLHPSEHRPITIREGARLMGFPDSFIFPRWQSMTSVGKQIGNAVPPPLARALAEALVETMES